MSYITTEQFNQLRKQVMDMSLQISSLQSQVACKTGVRIASHKQFYYSTDYDGTRSVMIDTPALNMLLNDKLPLNNCFGNLGILLLNDAIAYATYESIYTPDNGNSGWQVYAVAEVLEVV